jgi:ribose transport system permease protein
LNFGVDRLSGLYLGVLFIVTFGILKPHLFLTGATMHTIASQQAITAILGFAVVIPLAAGVFDLSIGAVMNLAAVVAVQLQANPANPHGVGMWVAIAAALGLGVLFGAVNGFLVVRLKVSSFIATLGSATVIAAIQEIITNQSTPIPPLSSAWRELTQRQVFGFQIVVIYVLVLAVILWWVLEKSPAGRFIYATGGNPEAARLTGVRVDRWVWLSFVASGTLSAVAGVLYASLVGATLNFGGALLLPAYAAAFLGSTQIKPGRFNVWGTLIAVYVLAIGVHGIQLMTTVTWLNDMFNGIALITAVAFAVWRQQRVKAERRRSGWKLGRQETEGTTSDDNASPELTPTEKSSTLV